MPLSNYILNTFFFFPDTNKTNSERVSGLPIIRAGLNRPPLTQAR